MRSRSMMARVDVDKACALSGSWGSCCRCKVWHHLVPHVQDSNIAKWWQPSGWCREGKQCWWGGRVDDKRWRRAWCGAVISNNTPAAKAAGVKHGMHQPGWRWGSRAPRKLEGHKSAREELRPQLKEQEVFLHSNTRITSESTTQMSPF
jgi:hypothetical protein